MSGGSRLNYLYLKVWDAPDQFEHSTPERAWFAAHLLHVAEALKSIEYEDCGDTGPECTLAALRAVMSYGRPE